MSYEIEYTDRARRHFRESYLWIKSRSPVGAEKWRDKLIASVETLSENPERCPLAPENEALGKQYKTEIRHLLYGKKRGQYRLLFTISKKRIVILDIRHSFRQWLKA